MEGRVVRGCHCCGSTVGFSKSDDGFFYCGYCNTQAEDMVETGIDDEQLFSQYTASCSRVRTTNAIPAEPVSQVKVITSQFLDHPNNSDNPDMEGDGVGPTEPSDFGSFQKEFTYEEYYSEIRLRYLKGLQIMIQLQSQALIEKFNVSPLIIGLVGPLWLRFLASTKILTDEWADSAVHDSEAQTQGAVHALLFMKFEHISFPMLLHWLSYIAAYNTVIFLDRVKKKKMLYVFGLLLYGNDGFFY